MHFNVCDVILYTMFLSTRFGRYDGHLQNNNITLNMAVIAAETCW